MSMFPRFLRPISSTAQRRSYSFFSSKSGGGRYFNSAKPPKVVPTTSGSGNGKASRADTSASASDSSSPAGAPKTPEDAPSSVPAVTQAQGTDVPPKQAAKPTAPSMHFSPLPSYPPLNAQDLKLHQFFSLHRPLSLYQPTSALFEPSAPAFDFGSLGKASARTSARTDEPASVSTGTDFDEVPEASPEADADAARQLARALVMNRVGGTLSWDAALQKMGLDVNEGRVSVEGVVVDMDSTKRKRRKKMKTHKWVIVPVRTIA
ncbi:hypothetical protein EWM64_g9535 [Hericium alpestre]|uniref:Uncharacterized protein n=1 Tax=Hericium alpestre TaxID=135208 RepID=A0A4Y9ZKC6_9AGAM|nr:hypothetical protein EWM64_g9535 [Hericium alpestre]